MTDPAWLTAAAGLAGAVIGGFTSFATSWMTQHTQIRENLRAEAIARREAIYTEFIKEASRLFGDALSHTRDEISDLIPLYALVARIRLTASPAIIAEAERVMDEIIATYAGPRFTLAQLRDIAHAGGFDPLLKFSETCRLELEQLITRKKII